METNNNNASNNNASNNNASNNNASNNNASNNNANSENNAQSNHELTAKQLKRQRIRQIVVSLIGVAILVWGIVKIGCMFMDYKSNEKSDDAQIEQYISLLARLPVCEPRWLLWLLHTPSSPTMVRYEIWL